MAARAFLALALMAALAAPAAAAPKTTKGPAPAASGAAPAGGKDPVVAMVNGQAIHRSEVIEVQREIGGPQGAKLPLEQVYAKVIGPVIESTVLEQWARRDHVQDDPEVRRALARAQKQILISAFLGREAKKIATEASLRQRYDLYAKNFKPHDEVVARHIILRTEEEAKAAIAELQRGADFATLARDRSLDDNSKANGGQLPPFSQDVAAYPKEFIDAAFKLQKGQLTPEPVKTSFGFHVIKLDDRHPAQMLTYEQAAPRIAQALVEENIQKQFAELQKEHKIEVFNPDGSRNGPPPQSSAPAPEAPAPAAQPQVPVPGAPTLSPATAPENLGKP